MKRSTMVFGMVVLAVLMMAVAPAMAQTQKADTQRTAQYLAAAWAEAQRTTSPVASAAVYRSAAKKMRAIPWQGVDSEAVKLVWQTADWLDRAAALENRKTEAVGTAAGGCGASVLLIGDGLANEDPVSVVAGAVVGLLTYLFADSEATQIDAQQKKLDREKAELDKRWLHCGEKFRVPITFKAAYNRY